MKKMSGLVPLAVIAILLIALGVAVGRRGYFGGKADPRSRIAAQYIRGRGIEIGALHKPLKVPGEAQVRYLDRLTVEELRVQYPELHSERLVHVDIVDDGERLAKVANASQDFIIACHFLEHCQNPILTIENMLRVLKKDGVIFLAIPDKRYTFDINRPATTYDHLLRDYNEGPGWSKRAHYGEWVRFVEKVGDTDAALKRADELTKTAYSIHFHAWTQTEILDLLVKMKERSAFDIEEFSKNGMEVIAVLRKTSVSAAL